MLTLQHIISQVFASNQVAHACFRTLLLLAFLGAGALTVSAHENVMLKASSFTDQTAVDTTVEASLCAGGTYVFGNQLLTMSGNYMETFTASDGTDSIVTLILTVLPAPVTELKALLCEGTSFSFAGMDLTGSGVYTDTLHSDSGCDSILVLTLKFVPYFETEQFASICTGDTVFFGGKALTESGVYVDSLTATGGCDSIETLHLTVKPQPTTTLEAGVCEGFTYIFNQDTLSVSGTYIDTLTAANGCDSIVTLYLTVADFFETNLSVTICDGSTYVFGGMELSASGVYTDSLQAAGGCDSTLILDLTVLPPTPTTFVEAAICDNEVYILGNDTLQAEGIYQATFAGSNGCDSVVVLTLTVLPAPTTDLEATICSNENYPIGGTALTEPGLYTFIFPATNGCDSTVNVSLTVLPAPETTLQATICAGASFSFEGQDLTESGTYSAVYPAENGCDSTVTLTLKVLPELVTNLSETICAGDSIEFDGVFLTEEGQYSTILTSTTGCDSTVYLQLSVAPLAQTNLEVTICSGDSYVFNGEGVATPGVYTAMLSTVFGCDSVVMLTLTVLEPVPETNLSASICDGASYSINGTTFTESGTYSFIFTTINGCDSVVLLSLDVLPVPVTQLEAAICAGESFEFAGQTLTTSGLYSDTLTAENGCDSLVLLQLTVWPVYETVLEGTICANETYPFDGQSLNTSGTYTANYTAETGCDSAVILNLNVLPIAATALEAVICSNSSYPFDGAQLTEPGVYTAVYAAENGCDSTVTLTLEVLPAVSTALEATICSNGSYDFDGQILAAAGVYEQVYTAENGCDSTVVLTLQVLPVSPVQLSVQICPGAGYSFNGEDLTESGTYTAFFTAENGCDSTVTLELLVLDTIMTQLQATICAGETFVFAGEELAESGSYSAIYPAETGCDSLVQLSLTVLPVANTELSATICAGTSYSFDNQLLAESGVYTAVLTAANGCDSTITLSLDVLPVSTTNLEASICAGTAYEFNGETLMESGSYSATLTGDNGCDSTVVLQLTVLPTASTQLAITICTGEAYPFNGEMLTETGHYEANLTGSNGCDSTATLELTVLPALQTSLQASICAGQTFEFLGEPLGDPGTYTAVLTSTDGCDSTVTLQLDVLPVAFTNLSAAICKGSTYEFNGQSLEQGGVYTAVLGSVNGCDSTVILELTVLPEIIEPLSASICSGESYPFAGQSLTTPGMYSATFLAANGCDSTVTLTLAVVAVDTGVVLQGHTLTAQAANATYQWIDCDTNQPINGATGMSFTPAVSGNYAVLVTLDGCTAQSACTPVTVVATQTPALALAWQMMPNPAQDRVLIRFEHPIETGLEIELFDLTGSRHLCQKAATGTAVVAIGLENLPEGLYWVRLTMGALASETRRLVKVK